MDDINPLRDHQAWACGPFWHKVPQRTTNGPDHPDVLPSTETRQMTIDTADGIHITRPDNIKTASSCVIL